MDQERVSNIRQMLSMIVEYYEEQTPELGSVKFYDNMAEQLSKVSWRKSPWTWRYVQGVHKGTIAPSDGFAKAIEALGATLDDTPALLAYSVRVEVLAKPGQQLTPGSVILAESRPCQWPGCRVHFVPKVPWQKYCSMELHVQAERERRRSRKGGQS